MHHKHIVYERFTRRSLGLCCRSSLVAVFFPEHQRWDSLARASHPVSATCKEGGKEGRKGGRVERKWEKGLPILMPAILANMVTSIHKAVISYLNLALVASGSWEKYCIWGLVGSTPRVRDWWNNSAIRHTYRMEGISGIDFVHTLESDSTHLSSVPSTDNIKPGSQKLYGKDLSV